jgi:hypothetical protein
VTRYPVRVETERGELWLAWESEDGPDRVVVDRRGFVLAWPSEAGLRSADQTVTGKSATVDGRRGTLLGGPIVCERVLNLWNLLGDICFSVGLNRGAERPPFERVGPPRRVDRLYEKLFFGCNLPALRGDGPRYEPTFSPRERRLLRRILRSGLGLLDRVLVPAG